jgi:hypothetical protein
MMMAPVGGWQGVFVSLTERDAPSNAVTLGAQGKMLTRGFPRGQSLWKIARNHRISRATVHRVIHEEMPAGSAVPKEA